MKDLKDKLVVITGAGSGIGRALSQAIARQGARLALADKNTQGLEETAALLKGADVKTWPLDVTDPQQVERFAQDLEKAMGPADVVVNNAGINSFARFWDTKNPTMHRIMDVNFWGTVYMTQAFLPQLMKRPESILVNVSSTLGLKGFFGQVIYSASKFAVRGFTEALQIETMDSPLHIVLVFPGGVKTKIHDSAFNEYPLPPEVLKQAVEEMNAKSRLVPEQAAKAILEGIQKKKSRVLIGVDAFGIDFLTRLFPVKNSFLLYLLRKSDPFWQRLKDNKPFEGK